ncbi:hypothetical protein ACLB2K_027126 [Fragaria x ananassa]
MEKAISWMLILLVIASCLSQFSEAKSVETCHKNTDCKRTSCAGSFVLCVNGICTCEVSGTSRDESAPVTDIPVVSPPCSSSSDCRFVLCETGPSVCIDGICSCKVSGTRRDESSPVPDAGVVKPSCYSSYECEQRIRCDVGMVATCYNGKCVCFHD